MIIQLKGRIREGERSSICWFTPQKAASRRVAIFCCFHRYITRVLDHKRNTLDLKWYQNGVSHRRWQLYLDSQQGSQEAIFEKIFHYN